MPPTGPLDNVLSDEQLRAIDVHAALDRSQDARRALTSADHELQAAESAFEVGLDDRVSSHRLSLLDTDVELATAAQASASWSHAESEVALVGAAGRSPDARRAPGAEQHHATFAAGPRAVSQVRGMLRGLLDGVVDDDLLGDVELMASEVATNCVRHERPVQLAVELDIRATSRHQLTVTVTVSGGGARVPDSLLWPTAELDTTAASGRGLDILDALAQVWGTQRRHRRTSVWFSVTAAVARRQLDQYAADHVARAAAVLAEAAAVTAEAEARVLREFEDAARRAAAETHAAVATAAEATARAVDDARRSRAAAARVAASSAAGLAASSARAVVVQRASQAQHQPTSEAFAAHTLAAAVAAAAVVADAVAAAAETARDLDDRAARADAHRAAQAAILVRDVAETAAEGAAAAVAAGVSRLQDAAAARHAVYDARFLSAVPVDPPVPPAPPTS